MEPEITSIVPQKKETQPTWIIVLLGILTILSLLFTFLLYQKVSQLELAISLLPTVLQTTTPTPTPTVTPTSSITITPSLEPTQSSEKSVTIAVYLFSMNKFNEENQTNYTSKVSRTTTRKDIATFGIEEIIKGPTAAEQTTSLTPTFGTGRMVTFSGASNCSNRDFSLSISNGNATVKFCKQTTLAGDSAAFVIEQQVISTLKQFSSVSKVRILTASGQCFNNMSGIADPNTCYQ